MALPAPELSSRVEEDLEKVFENVDLAVPEGYRAELIEGEIVVSPPPDGDHEDIVGELTRQVLRNSTSELYASGTKGLDTPSGRLIPDSTVGPTGLFRGREPRMSPEGVLLVAEVTSLHPERDRHVKRRGYAAAEIPAYLLVDRSAGEAVLYSEPRDGDYRADVRVPFGKSLDLPKPFSFALDTTSFS